MGTGMKVFHFPNFTDTLLIENPPFSIQSFFEHSWNGIRQNSLLSIHPRAYPANPYGLILDLSPDEFKQKFANAKFVRLSKNTLEINGVVEPIEIIQTKALSLKDLIQQPLSSQMHLEILDQLQNLIDQYGEKSPLDVRFHGPNSLKLNHYLKAVQTATTDKKLIQSLVQLVGRGQGLTPTGDDFIIGFLASLWYHKATELIDVIANGLHPPLNDSATTTFISRHYLLASLNGYFVEWFVEIYQNLLQQTSIQTPLNNIANMGHSSGLDTIYGLYEGFLWIQRKEIKYEIHSH
jgi:hypothetical protein